MNRSASACSRIGALDGLNGVRRRRLAERRLQRGERLGGSPHPLAHRPGDVEPRLHALRRGPRVADVGKAVRASRLPERHAQETQRLQVKPWVVRLKSGRPRRGDDEFERRANLAALRRPGAVVRDERRDDHREVAVAVLNFSASVATRSGGGSSATKWRTSLIAICFAVAGCGRDRRGPRAPAHAGLRIGLAEDFREPGSCQLGLKSKAPSAPDSPFGPDTLQPVMARANSVTSA